MEKIDLINSYLDELFPEPKCELNYSNDYELLISIMLSAQSTDKRVNQVTSILFDKYKSLEALNEANIDDLENIIRSVGSFRKKSQYIKDIASTLITKYNGVVPRNHDLLVEINGIGRKTANVFLSEYYNEPYIAVDTHVSRVSKRLGLARKNDDVLTIEKKLQKKFDKSLWARRHLQMVLFGRYKCKAISPLCSDCKLKDICNEKKKK
ncbi:MAG: endonuclease III [Bacilli bacterium]|nr:endonuclease III [Bacilli bacterium]